MYFKRFECMERHTHTHTCTQMEIILLLTLNKTKMSSWILPNSKASNEYEVKKSLSITFNLPKWSKCSALCFLLLCTVTSLHWTSCIPWGRWWRYAWSPTRSGSVTCRTSWRTKVARKEVCEKRSSGRTRSHPSASPSFAFAFAHLLNMPYFLLFSVRFGGASRSGGAGGDHGLPWHQPRGSAARRHCWGW